MWVNGVYYSKSAGLMCLKRKEVSALEVIAKIREIGPFILCELHESFPDQSRSVIHRILQIGWKVWRRTFSIKGIQKIWQLSRYSDLLQSGRSGDRIPVGARFSAPVQTGRGAHPASCTMGTGSFPGVKSGRSVTLTPHPFQCRGQERVELYVYSPYGPYGLYRASVPVQGCTLTLPYEILSHNMTSA
jgi:hypothetical protein